jgi:hypothetical protein
MLCRGRQLTAKGFLAGLDRTLTASLQLDLRANNTPMLAFVWLHQQSCRLSSHSFPAPIRPVLTFLWLHQQSCRLSSHFFGTNTAPVGIFMDASAIMPPLKPFFRHQYAPASVFMAASAIMPPLKPFFRHHFFFIAYTFIRHH